jgi:NADPH:quinone reductase-like Zn-dependent oxidoreductase
MRLGTFPVSEPRLEEVLVKVTAAAVKRGDTDH